MAAKRLRPEKAVIIAWFRTATAFKSVSIIVHCDSDGCCEAKYQCVVPRRSKLAWTLLEVVPQALAVLQFWISD